MQFSIVHLFCVPQLKESSSVFKLRFFKNATKILIQYSLKLSKTKISWNFLAISEYVNFIRFSFIMNRYFDCLMVNTNTQGHSPFNDHTKFCRVRAKCDQIRVLISHDSRKNSIKCYYWEQFIVYHCSHLTSFFFVSTLLMSICCDFVRQP